MCPVCAALPGGDPNHVTDDFAAHLTLEHRAPSRDILISSLFAKKILFRNIGGTRNAKTECKVKWQRLLEYIIVHETFLCSPRSLFEDVCY